MLGHANPAVTLRVYTGVLDSMSAATDEKLDEAFRQGHPRQPSGVLRHRGADRWLEPRPPQQRQSPRCTRGLLLWTNSVSFAA